MSGKNAAYLSLRVAFGTKLFQAQQAEFMPEVPDAELPVVAVVLSLILHGTHTHADP
jgi:hypothetical protein